MHGDTEEAGLSPGGAPEVAAGPIVLAVFGSPPDNLDVVVDGGVDGCLGEDSPSVFSEGCRNVHSANDWPVG